MKRWTLYIPFVVFVLLGLLLWRGLYLDPKHVPSALVDKPFPTFALPTLVEGETKTEASLKGGPVHLVNVWGTWCISCKVEHPFLVELSQQGVAIMGVNYKDENDAARKWLNDLGDPYVFSVDDEQGTLSMDLGVTGAPETFVVDSQGVIRHRHQGPITRANWDGIKQIMDQLAQETVQ